MPLHIPTALRRKLETLRAKQLLERARPDEVVADQDLVILTLGLGPAIYLGLDGQVVIWHYMEDEPPRITEDIKDIAVGLVIAAKRHDMPELLELLPRKPATAAICPLCFGQRWVTLAGRFRGDKPDLVVCWECRGLGWR